MHIKLHKVWLMRKLARHHLERNENTRTCILPGVSGRDDVVKLENKCSGLVEQRDIASDIFRISPNDTIFGRLWS
jgi:hypothetical protein